MYKLVVGLILSVFSRILEMLEEDISREMDSIKDEP